VPSPVEVYRAGAPRMTSSSTPRRRARALPLLLAAGSLACLDGGVSITVRPSSATVVAGGEPLALSASVTGTSEGVTWSLFPPDAGAVSPASGVTTFYTPPAAVPVVTRVRVTAAAGALAASAEVSVQPGSAGP
jgi:hypothetical protein